MASPYMKQAPQMMSALAPDLQAQQMELSRQQQLADMLRQQGSTPIQQQVAGGHVVKISPWEGIAKMLTAGVGGYMQSQNDKKQVELGSEMVKRRADALKLLAPAGVFQDQGVGAELTSNPQASTPGAQVPPNIKKAWINALSLSESNPELSGKLIQNLSELTNNQKDWAAQGLDPAAVGAAEMGKLKASGLVNVSPNSTVLDASTNKPVFAAPDFNSGRQNSFGPNGQPQISQMQGSEIIPQMAGQVKRAEAAGAAGFDMVTVNTPNGPVMMTREQAAQQAAPQPQGQPAPQVPQQAPQQAPQGPQTPNMGFPAGTQMPSMTGAATPENRIATLQQERAQMVARNATPTDLQMIDREIANVSRAGAPAMSASPNAAGMPGIPLQTDAQKERDVGKVKVQNAVDETLAKALPQELRDRQDAIVKGESALTLINKALNHPGMKAATGLQGTIDPRNYIPGTNAKDFQVVMDQLGGQTFLQAMQSLRGTGQITEIEGKKASDAIARLNRSQSTGEFETALNDFKSVVSKGIERTKGERDSIDVARDKLAPPNAKPPTVQDLLKLYGGK